jgi:hypothetical protein
VPGGGIGLWSWPGRNIAEIDESMFTIDILRDLEEMNVAPADEEAAD